ncbi:DDT domain-containing protein DDR4 [Cynara cardunculus var. scolymus]|uniref:DDT domain-containing protein n=1 Tax=Cynara cardunculus var. scolymus TaxID=59895 RepID=A0A103XZR5_CYNCS|nr:DDT domain-containing protein DDR4 [Cynara cardunculus var. scolymus]KVH99872.1 hypothetical protein Ccrd_021873 [Cynara cardunculus var. scolymus]
MNENGHQSPSGFEDARSRLRQRWELASVLNFFKVFEPVIEGNLKISAEEIETALIIPNNSLAQLHVALLKGIPPVSKNLKDPNAWVVALSKKLSMWWPWVAEGDFPLIAAKGEETATYKELDPTVRLVLLKALCEIRADQHDVVSYINNAVKVKNELSTFRKDNIGKDGKGTSYWCDGNEIIGFRLYKEVNTFRKNEKLPTISCQWETLATNLEEFQKVVDEYSSSKSKVEVAVSVAVETEVIPVLNKLEKKKQRALQKKKDEERVINNFCRTGITRSCRSRRPISYTFDEYDKAINEAIRETKRMKTKDEQRNEKKENAVNEKKETVVNEKKEAAVNEEKEAVVNEDSEQEDESMDGESTESESDSESSKLETEDVSEDSRQESDEEEAHANDDDDDNKENMNHSSENGLVLNSRIQNGSYKTRGSKKIIANGGDPMKQMGNYGAKKRLRQRPNRNTALESAVVPDSEDEISSDS